MKKTWIVILVILGALFTLQQRVFSRQSILLAQSEKTFCDISNYSQDSTRLYSCCISKTPPDAECAKCITSPVPTVCYPWITLTPGALDITLTGIPNTPIPVETLPLTTLTVTPDPTPIEKTVITIATYNAPDGVAGTNNADNVGTGDAVETKVPVPNTPIPNTPKPPNRASAQTLITPPLPTITPPNTPRPQPIVYPTLTPQPTQPILPDSFTKGTEKTKNKITTTLDTTKLADIKIVPNAYAAEKGPTEKPLLPQEQKQHTQNTPSGGILITLDQKTGSQYVTRQDELTVKRGDQLFTISNQADPATLPKNAPSAAPELEINANNVIAHLSMGISVDPLSGILTVDTPSGPQKVSIMPDEALGIILELKALNGSGVVTPSILLSSEKGQLLYRISGAKVEKFLGLFPLAVQKQILVSADTGSIVKVELSLMSQFLSFFTF